MSIKNLCATCGADFSSLGNFDRHRIGEHGKTRRCMTPDEMTADGMRVNSAGRWAGEENHYWAERKADDLNENQTEKELI